MAGRRILAAKHLAGTCWVSTANRIAVIAFQERDARVDAPFTCSYSAVEDGLAAFSRWAHAAGARPHPVPWS